MISREASHRRSFYQQEPPYDCMHIPTPRPGQSDLLDANCALFLDVDGTLLHIAEHPDDVEVSDQLRAALAELAPALANAVALVSGRAIADLDRLFAPLVLPTAGLHGLERRGADQHVRNLGDSAALDGLRRALGDFAAANPGVLLEDKGRTLALHYRRAPGAETDACRLVERLTAERRDELRVIHGKMVLEIKPRLSDKGAAIAAYMTESPFVGRVPVFIGDDVTDEDGFATVNTMQGISIRVGNERETQALYQLDDVAAVLDWLHALSRQLTAKNREA